MYILLLTSFLGLASADRIINTNNGPVQGVSSLAHDVEAFLGIPYAEPPIGELRFSKPVPKKKWSETHKASNFPPPCTQFGLEPQYYFMPEISNMSEDCLYLNIWAPKSESSQGLRPVVVFIHPGAFVTGSSNLPAHDGSHFASRGDLVVVTINYRLGTLGFFLAFIKEANGNMGMFDQVMALKWIKDNAKYFGGDPENIVLMGASAGGYSISAHMVSPLSKDLFKRVIVQSGTLLSPILMDDNAELFKSSELVANHVGCANETVTLKNDPQTVVKCMKLKPKEAFGVIEKQFLETKPAFFYPRVNDEFLPKNNSADFFREGTFRKDVDVMIGMIEEEGTLLLMAALPDFFGNYGRNYENNLSKVRALTISRAVLASMGLSKNSSEITNFYLSQVRNRTPVGYVKMLANMLGDFIISCSTVFLADFLSVKGNPVYFYRFGFRSPSTPMEEWIGTTHLDELQYIFGNPYHDNFTREEIELSQRLMDRWSAFARTGNPNIPGNMPWLQYSLEKPLYLNFGQEEESIRMRPNKRCEIWRKGFNAQFDSELIQFLRNSEPYSRSTNEENTEKLSMFRVKGWPHFGNHPSLGMFQTGRYFSTNNNRHVPEDVSYLYL